MSSTSRSWTATAIARAVETGERRAEEVVRHALRGIAEVEPGLGAYLTSGPEAAEQAAGLDAALARGAQPGPLAGVPIAVKDNICTAGLSTTCGSRLLAGYRPVFDATVVERLRAAGAIVVGKTNLDEFGMGSSGENSAFGATVNPWSPERVPGGSSSGSAAAVAARTVPVALGSDTGGSVRQPAALCGLIGVLPTYGRVSRRGLVAFASSLDSVGLLARDVADARRVLRVIAGHDARDATSQPAAETWRPSRAGSAPRLGLPRSLVETGLADGVAAALAETTARFVALGATIVPIELPPLDLAVAAYHILSGAEAASNLARFDGVRYGARHAAEAALETMVAATRSAGFGAEVKRRIMIGTYVLRSGYYEAYVRRAAAARAWLARALSSTLSELTAILLPTSPTTAFPRGERLADPLTMYRSDLFTIPVNMAGLPAVSFPVGFDADGLPIGMQLVGRHWEEETLLDLARRYEASHGGEMERRPPICAGWAGEGPPA